MKLRKITLNYFKSPFVIWGLFLTVIIFFSEIHEVQLILDFILNTSLHLIVFGIAFILSTFFAVKIYRNNIINHLLKNNRNFLFIFIAFITIILSAEIPLYFVGILNLVEQEIQVVEEIFWYESLLAISATIGFYILPGLMIIFQSTLRETPSAYRISDIANTIIHKLLKIIPFLILIPVFWFSYESLSYFTIKNNLLEVFISASSIIVALIIGFLFNSYFNIKQLRLEKLSRFVELQNKIRPYQQAFWTLSEQIFRKYGYDMFQLPIPLETLQRDHELWQKDEYVPIVWTRAIYGASSLPFDTPDFEISHKIITKDRLNEMYDQVSQAMGLLGRYKHYQYLLRVFQLPDTQDLDQVHIANDTLGMKYHVKDISKEGDDYTTLSFWENKLEEWHDILERMKSNGRFIYSFVSSDIKKLSTYLLFIAGFGVLIPITLLSFNNIPMEIDGYLRNLSMIGFITYFSLSLSNIYKRLTSDKLRLD